MSSEVFTALLRETLYALQEGAGESSFQEYLDELSDMLSQGAQGNLYPVVYSFRSDLRERVPYMHRIEELIYFLLSEGVVPTIEVIRVCCVRAETRLLEDLLKYYEGPLEIEFVHNRPSDFTMNQVVEVLYGFGIKMAIQTFGLRSRYPKGLSPLEYFFIGHGLGLLSSSTSRLHIKEARRVCHPPDKEKVFDMGRFLDLERARLMEAWDIYQGKK